MTHDEELLFICSCAIFVYFLVRCLWPVLKLVYSSGLLLCSFKSFLYILDSSLFFFFYQMNLLQIFSPSLCLVIAFS